MFMKDDKKKSMAAVIIAKKKAMPEGEVEEISNAPKTEDNVMSDYDMGMDTCAEDIMSAFESKDKKALISALKSFMSMAESQDDDTERANPESEES